MSSAEANGEKNPSARRRSMRSFSGDIANGPNNSSDKSSDITSSSTNSNNSLDGEVVTRRSDRRKSVDNQSNSIAISKEKPKMVNILRSSSTSPTSGPPPGPNSVNSPTRSVSPREKKLSQSSTTSSTTSPSPNSNSTPPSTLRSGAIVSPKESKEGQGPVLRKTSSSSTTPGATNNNVNNGKLMRKRTKSGSSSSPEDGSPPKTRKGSSSEVTVKDDKVKEEGRPKRSIKLPQKPSKVKAAAVKAKQKAVATVTRKRIMRSELDKLLMDEGTVNMLYDNNTKKETKGISGSKEDKLAQLSLRRIEVFNKVRKQTAVSTTKKLLREKKEVKKEENGSTPGEGQGSSPNHLIKSSIPRGLNFTLNHRGVNGGAGIIKKMHRKRASLLSSMRDERMMVNDNDPSLNINKKSKDDVPLTPYETYLAATKEPLKARQSKYVLVRKCDRVGHVILTGSGGILPYSLSPGALHELNIILMGMQKDSEVAVVLLSSSGPFFCQGIDLSCLIANDAGKRRKLGEEMSLALREFLTTLANYSKVLIAAVGADAIGLGVTMLPLFDLVYASDKATFKTPYCRLGQVPEGLASLTLPQMLGGRITNAMIYGGKTLTATEALSCGLVTEVLWPARFQEELNVRVRTVANQSSQAMISTKALLRQFFRMRIESVLNNESKLLTAQWYSHEFQSNARKYLEACK